jgi:hypothetical protein
MFEQMDEAAYCNIPQYFLLVGFCRAMRPPCNGRTRRFKRNFFVSLFKIKINTKLSLDSLKTLTNSLYYYKTASEFLPVFSSLPLVDFRLCFSAIGRFISLCIS